MKNTNKNKNTTELPMPGKVKKGFRFYCAVVMALAFTHGCSMTVFAEVWRVTQNASERQAKRK